MCDAFSRFRISKKITIGQFSRLVVEKVVDDLKHQTQLDAPFANRKMSLRFERTICGKQRTHGKTAAKKSARFHAVHVIKKIDSLESARAHVVDLSSDQSGSTGGNGKFSRHGERHPR